MSFRNSFPWTFAFWRFLNRRPVRIVVGSFALMLFVTMASFRIQSLLFQRRVNSVLSRMAKVNLDRTSEKQLRDLLPEMKRVERNGKFFVDGPESGNELETWYELDDGNGKNGSLINLVYRLGNHSNQALTILYRLGNRFRVFAIRSRIRQGIVDRVTFFLMVETGEPFVNEDIVVLDVKGYGRSGWDSPKSRRDLTHEDVRPYSAHVASNMPQNTVFLSFTPDAPEQFIHSAFDVHLDCLWNFLGCRTARQMLPGVWPPQFAWRQWHPTVNDSPL